MSIRLRVALFYGALFAGILFLVLLFHYAIHARSQYDDIDRTLVVSVEHAEQEAQAMGGRPHLTGGKYGFEIDFRFYRSDGTVIAQTSGAETLPAANPVRFIRQPSGPAFDRIAAIVPSFIENASTNHPGGAFGLLSSADQRWRVYVAPFQNTTNTMNYIVAYTPLGYVDAALQTYRFFSLSLGILGLIAALIGSWLIAGNALFPLARMITTAQAISLSGDLSCRISVPAHKDELYRLATIFNEMLVSVEASQRIQQRFVSDASHELRAPLTAIQGNLDILRRHQQQMTEDEREESFAEMTSETERLSRLVADLLALARADAGIEVEHTQVDLDSVVLHAFRAAQPLVHGQTLALDPFEPAVISGDADRLAQLLLILLDNGLKYTPAGGTVTVGLRSHERGVELLVRDTGIGIAEEDIPHVFERFYRADRARRRDPGGTGLGLSVAQWIVAQHHAEMILQSTVGQGTLITVQFPGVPSSQ
jgi:Signal transduction histidine kinase